MSGTSEVREKIRMSLERYISASGYTQKEIADKLGVSKSSVTNWLKGKNSPDANLVMPICKLLNITIAQFYGEDEKATVDKPQLQKNAPPYSGEALQLAEDYDGLDGHGKRVVRLVADEEKARCEDDRQAKAAVLRESREQTEAAEEIAPDVFYIVPGFISSMSAGTGQVAGDDYPENYRLVKAPPRGTSYIAPIDGNSMEPTYQSGDKLFIHACTNILQGQIGVFFMDGKQWVKELGDGVLISHNETYEPRQMTEDIICQGLVLGVCDESYFE